MEAVIVFASSGPICFGGGLDNEVNAINGK